MKILQINSVVNTGSTGRIAEGIGQAVIKNGWKSYIAYGRNERTSQSNLVKIGSDWDVKMHGLQTRIFDNHGLASKAATIALTRQIDDIKPDVIHLHNLHGYYLNFQILFSYLNESTIPVVWTFHDFWPVTGHCAYFSKICCEKWKTECYHCPQKSSYPSSIFIDRAYRNFKLKQELFNSVPRMTIVPVSDWIGEQLKHSFLSTKSFQVIKNGIDLDVFLPQSKKEIEIIKRKYGIGNRSILLGVATSWSARKNLEDYIKLNEFLTNDFVIVLVGLTKEQLKKIPLTMIGIERTENISELASLYSAADIVLNLSTEESFGLTTVEGFACGTPGIVYNCTASPELITIDTGCIVESGNIKDLILAIKKIKLKGKGNYTINCRIRAEMFYNKNDRYRDYLNLYKSLMQ